MRRLPAAVVLAAALATACGAGEVTLDRADGSASATADAAGDNGPVPTTAGDPSAGPAPTDTLGGGSGEPTEPPPPPAPPIEWRTCGAIECATVTAPRDHDDPGGPTVALAVGRRPATGDRIGALFVNFGGPGAGAVDRLASLALPDEVARHFDIVGVDPRGTGGSVAFDCGLDPRELYALDPTFEDDADRRVFLDTSQRYVDDCAARHGDLLPHLGSRDLAGDLDVVRAALGDETLSYLGYSYGTVIGQTYLARFPNRVRSMVLDGVVDTGLSGLDAALGQSRGLDLALGRWAGGCDRRSTCPDDDPIGAVRSVLQAAEDGIPANGRTLGPGSASVGVVYPLYSESLWPSLDRAVTDALDGRGAALYDLADSYTSLLDFAVYFGVNCLDSSWPQDPQVVIDRAAGAGGLVLGTAVVIDYLRCALWPVGPDPIGAVDGVGAPPTLVVSTTGDPATPHVNAERVADRLVDGHLLTYEGDGHLIVFRGSNCVDDVTVDYLLTGAVPAPGARC